MDIIFEKENYTKLLNILDAISKNCTDCEIRNSQIRIRSDNKSIIYDINISEIVNDFSLCISALQNFVDLIKIFTPQDDEQVHFKTEENSLIIKDKFMTINLSIPYQDLLQNKYIEDSQLQNVGFFEKQPIFETKISEYILSRILALSKNFSVNTINLKVTNKNLTMQLQSSSKTKVGTFNIPVNECNLDDGNYIISQNLFMFPFENDEITLSLYNLSNGTLIAGTTDNKSSYLYSGVIVEQ